MFWVFEMTTVLCTSMTVNGGGAVHHPEEPVVPVLYQVKLRRNGPLLFSTAVPDLSWNTRIRH